MPWIPMKPAFADRYDEKVLGPSRGITKFVLDANADEETMLKYLDGLGLSTALLPLKLLRARDEDVLAEAWRLDRVLLTHDRGFLDTDRHPPDQSHPGVVVMPGGSGDAKQHLTLIGNVLIFMQPLRRLWYGINFDVGSNGVTRISGIESTHGRLIEPWFLRFDSRGNAETWVADEAGAGA